MAEDILLSRRSFFKVSVVSGISIFVAPLSRQAFAALFEEQILTPIRWDPTTQATDFRIDGTAKVMGKKVFARDIRAKDLPHWPQHQSHALILRIPCADKIFVGIDLSFLGNDLQPDRVVTAADLERDKLILPAFYGQEPLLSPGKSALYLGHAVAILIYHDFARFAVAKDRLKFTESFLRYGDTVSYREADPYGSLRFVRIQGETRQAPDRYSALKDNDIFARYKRHSALWPNPNPHGRLDERGMAYAQQIDKQLRNPTDDWLVMTRRYLSQSIDPAALEPDNTNGWYDAAQQTLHLVIASQSPADVADSVATMLASSRYAVKRLFIHPCYTVGYGSKDHSIFPLYGLLATLYANNRPVRLANDRYEQFQATMKRHAFDMTHTIAIDRHTGKFQIFRSNMSCNGGGRANFSASVAACGATAAQSVYYFPKNDIAVVANYSRAVEAGSMRGYGTLQTMTATELLVDEIAEKLGVDAIDLRLKNALRSGDKNTQGAIPGGVERITEVLQQFRDHPVWKQRHTNKKQYEAKHPGKHYGVGFACVQKDFGIGADAAFASVELDKTGNITLYHSGAEIGTGMSTSQAVNCAKWLGRPASKMHTAQLDWQTLAMKTSGNPFLMSQTEQDRLARDPQWTPSLMSAASASNSSYFNSQATLEASRLIFLFGLWPAALSVWQQGIQGGAAQSFVVRQEDARWTAKGLTADGMEPLPLERLASIAHEQGLLTGAMVHSFNRWQWAEGIFPIQGALKRLPLDGLALRWGNDSHFSRVARQQVFYPPTQRNNAGVTYYSTMGTLVEVAVQKGSGKVDVLNHHSIVECGNVIVPELVSGQLQGGLAMGIGHALYEYLPLYEDGPGNGTWNFNRYHLPRASEVAVWQQTAQILPPLSDSDPAKGMAEVVMIPIVAGIVTAIHHAIGIRFYDLPVTPEKIREQCA